MQPLLDVRQLKVQFRSETGWVEAVKGIDFSIAPKETVAIVGESGSGKSVSSLALMQLLPAQAAQISGEAIWTPVKGVGCDLLKLSPKQAEHHRGKDIGMIFQEPMTSLNPVHRCGEQVAEILTLHTHLIRKHVHERVIHLFEEVELPRPEEIYKAYPHELSGGQKQRVMIAMAIACRPQLLIADEPTTALDVTVQARVLQILKKLQQQHQMAMLFITHDLGVVAEIADRVIVMNRGEIVEQGPVKDIFTHPQHSYTRGLLACRPALAVKGQRLQTISNFLETEPKTEAKEQPVIHEKSQTVTQSAISGPKNTTALLVEVKNLQVHYPLAKNWLGKPAAWVKAVDNVSFDIQAGETIGLVGESGCGKTTLGRALLRLVEPTGGEVRFAGQDLRQVPAEQLRKLRKDFQIIFQDPYASLNPRLTVGEAIAEPMQVHGVLTTASERKARVSELLETVGLPAAYALRYPHEFSGGQRQRISIARAIALRPKLVICDESVSALDVSVQAQVLNLLNDLKQQFGMTYLFITHDLSVARYMSDRLMVMRQGKIVEMGPSEEVYRNPREKYTQQLLAAVPKL